MTLPRLLVTGSSGFVGRHLLDALKEDYRIIGLARRSQARSGAPVHENISWHQVDIAQRRRLEAVFQEIREAGGADLIVHLAAHYDFTGDEDPEYERTNVVGLRNVLELSRALSPKRFIFSSSVAACDYPPDGATLDESSPPNGAHIYARTKAVGERMVGEFSGSFPTTIVRFAALFSDWCEYAPLFVFLSTWLSRAWNRRVLGGQGRSAIPFLHVREVPAFIRRVFDRLDVLGPGEIVIASPDGAVSHRELFEAATLYFFGRHQKPLLMPKPLCRPGMVVRDFAGRLIGERPFERPWMADHIDRALAVDAARTRARLDWTPHARLEILRRIPFMLENLRSDPLDWHRKNRAAMKQVQPRSHLRVHALLEDHEEAINAALAAAVRGAAGSARLPRYAEMTPESFRAYQRIIFRHLTDAVRTGDKGVFMTHCAHLAEQRFGEGFAAEEVCEALEAIDYRCQEILGRDPEAAGLEAALQEHLTMTIRFGCDRVLEVFEDLGEAGGRRRGARGASAEVPALTKPDRR